MKKENINENTIRVLIDGSDLEARGITFLDLLGNQQQIESFFYSILEEVDVDNRFHDSDAITFQVLPHGNGLELFISKGTGAEGDNGKAGKGNQLDQVVDYIRKQSRLSVNKEKKVEKKPVKQIETEETSPLEILLKFQSFEDFVMLAKRLRLQNGVSSLFQYKSNYYLSIVFFTDKMKSNEMDKEILLALEYGEESDLATEVLSEYGKCIMEDNALETSRKYFK